MFVCLSESLNKKEKKQGLDCSNNNLSNGTVDADVLLYGCVLLVCFGGHYQTKPRHSSLIHLEMQRKSEGLSTKMRDKTLSFLFCVKVMGRLSELFYTASVTLPNKDCAIK